MYCVVARLLTGCMRRIPVYVRRVCVDLMHLGVWRFVTLLCLLRECIALEIELVSLGLHCFLRLPHALCCCSRRGLGYVALAAQHTTQQQALLPYEHTTHNTRAQ